MSGLATILTSDLPGGGALIARALLGGRRIIQLVAARLRTVRPEVWLLVALGALLLAFAIVLVLQPTVGRGGR